MTFGMKGGEVNMTGSASHDADSAAIGTGNGMLFSPLTVLFMVRKMTRYPLNELECLLFLKCISYFGKDLKNFFL